MRGSWGTIIFAVILIAFAFFVVRLISFNDRGENGIGGEAIGFNGLGYELENIDIDVTYSSSRIRREVTDFDASLVPLFSADLWDGLFDSSDWIRSSGLPYYPQGMSIDEYEYKIEHLPSIVLFPKYYNDFLSTHVAAKPTISDQLTTSYYALFSDIGFVHDEEGKNHSPLRLGAMRFYEFEVEGQKLALFAPQYMLRSNIPSNCEEMVGFELGALILNCQIYGIENDMIFVLDPDLMNNHGLSLGENSVFAREFVANWMAQHDYQKLYIDQNSEVTLRDSDYQQVEQYERNSDDVKRLFSFPLSLVWISLLAILGLLFWRGAVRFGPALEDKNQSTEVSDKAAVEAMAHILRLTGNDAKIVSDFVRRRLEFISKRVLGEGTNIDPVQRYFDFLQRQNSKDANEFVTSAQGLMSLASDTSAEELQSKLDQFKNLAKKVIGPHEFD